MSRFALFLAVLAALTFGLGLSGCGPAEDHSDHGHEHSDDPGHGEPGHVHPEDESEDADAGHDEDADAGHDEHEGPDADDGHDPDADAS